MTLGNVDTTNPAQNQAPANTPSAAGTFNPDGSRLLTSHKGKLTLRNGTTGAAIADVTTSGPALFPDWSPDGGKIVFVRPSSPCVAGLVGDWGQDSVIGFGGALVTMDYDAAAGTFSNEQVIFPADKRNAYYPSYSPDGTWIAFTRTDGITKMSWSGANTACTGADGTGGNYDNPSATTWLLPAKGGTAVELATANGAPMQTNSWPKWGPSKDGEYLWLSFTSTRPYGNVLTGANAHHQLWITAVRAPGGGEAQKGDPSTPAVWFPFQNTVTKNHIGMWSVNVTTYVIN
jgi:Tol biopolymer transport system component